MPGNRPGDVAYFGAKRDEIARALEAAGRDPAAFTFAAQLSCGATADSRREALETARAFLAAGANHVILGVPATMAPDGLAVVADEVAEPLAERAAAASPLGLMDGADAAVRRIEPGDDAGLREFVDIVNAVTPESPTSIAEIRWSDDLYPGGTRFLGSLDGRTGGRRVGRADLHVRGDRSRASGSASTSLPDARRRGLGTALWARLLGGRPRAGQDRPPDRRLGTTRRRRRVPRAPRVPGHGAREDGPARPARASRRRTWRRRTGST